MKKDIRIIALGVALSATALTGCSRFEEEDLFEESAALRIEHNADKLQDILVDAPEGWVMQYYTGRGEAVFEGFNLFAKFEKNGKVLMAGDHRYLRDGNANQYTEAASLYEVIHEDGLVLAFNTWNDILTPFVDPVAYWAAPNILLKDGAGMEGDQNLVVTSISEDEITFRGERYSAQIRMVKADRDWQTYLADTKAMKERFTSDAIDSYYITADGTTMYCVGLRDGRYRISERVKSPLQTDSISCCFTPTGFRNESTRTLAGHTFQEFTLNEDGTALVNEDGTVRIVATWDTYLAETDEIFWLDGESVTGNLKALYDQLITALEAANKVYFPRIGIGRSTKQDGDNNVPGLVVEWYTVKRNLTFKNWRRGGLTMGRSVPDMGQLTLSYADDATADNDFMEDLPAAQQAMVREFAAALAGTYQMTPNSNFAPTEVTLRAINGDSSFRVAKD